MRYKLEPIPGTNLIVPALDNSAALNIKKSKTLRWDTAFGDIPEIKALREGDVVYDVGAYIGDTTAEFLSHGCDVHAFEPRPDLFVCLINNCPDAMLYNIALGNGDSYGTTERGGNMGAYPLEPGNKHSLRLDDFRVTRMDFLKLDAEGYEGNIIRGALETLKKFEPVIHLELNPAALKVFGDTPETIVGLLRGVGYTVWREVYRNQGPQGPHWDCIVKKA